MFQLPRPSEYLMCLLQVSCVSDVRCGHWAYPLMRRASVAGFEIKEE
jgi:hypothetical protein